MLGKKLAHYDIIEMLGKGGMGEVYRANDTKLGRDVAIKILPSELSGDPERAARFEREARTLASLQHANIASIYGYELDGETRFLAMELADGEDLSQRLARGPIPVDDVVDYGIQFAAGLDAAHAINVIHRDIKPANIKIATDGTLKILDFGLARAYSGDASTQSNPEHSPTITSAMTQAGVILGTAAYMSPEQARGKAMDHRTDVWGFGVVMFEMLSGHRLFDGETVSDTLAGVLRADIPWDRLPDDTPPALHKLLERCLERDPTRRLQAIGEARIFLENIKAGDTGEVPIQALAEPTRGFGRERIVWIALVAALALGLMATQLRSPTTPTTLVTQSTFAPPVGWDFSVGAPFAVAPDGRRIAFVAIARPENEDADAGERHIFIKDLAEADPVRLVEVDGEAYPFWSPDGRWVAFYDNGKLNKIEARGGPVIPLCDAQDGRGGTWNDAGTIIFQPDWSEHLEKVSSGGGQPGAVTQLNKKEFDVAHRWPQFLPDGRRFLFYKVNTTNTVNSELSGIYLGSLDSDEIKFLLRSESRGVYSDGNIVYRFGSTLMARPFDVDREEFTGDPLPIANNVTGGAVSWGGAHFGVVDTGVLVYMRGAIASRSILQWRDRQGTKLESLGEPDNFFEPSLSHDGTRVVVNVGHDVGDLWIYDVKRGTRTRFTYDAADDRSPLWSPNDDRIAFDSPRNGPGELWTKSASGQGQATLLHTFNSQIVPSQWTWDGRYILVSVLSLGENGWDLWVYDFETNEARALIASQFNDMSAQLSPNGKWLTYVSDEAGAAGVYVQSFPEGASRWMISSGASWEPIWRPDGKEICFLGGSGNQLVSVPVTTDGEFTFGEPTKLMDVPIKNGQRVGYSYSSDGLRFLMNELPPADANQVGARLIQNWQVILER